MNLSYVLWQNIMIFVTLSYLKKQPIGLFLGSLLFWSKFSQEIYNLICERISFFYFYVF
jgi:hypothetical protein